jgi:hypothetical protein
MAPTPIPLWREIKAQAIAGTLVVVAASTLGGIGYLIHRVPAQLDRVIENQAQFRGRLERIEREVDNHGDRIIRLEATK